MLPIFAQAETLGIQKYSRNSNKTFEYGTAGFRDKSTELPHVMYRMGLLAALRSKALNGQVVGLMITASHNPEEDNGLKLCEPLGDMLNKDWEVLAKQLVNAKNEELAETLEHILTTNNIKYDESACVCVAKDTRSSSSSLANAAIDGVTILQGEVKDFGLLTTPQLHYVVCCHNNDIYGHPSVEWYYKKLSSAFESMKIYQKRIQCTNYKPEVHLDGANGVGGYKMKEILEYLKSVTVHVFNDGSVGILNYKCGADFVKVEQKPPEGFQIMKNKRYASFDGDADRLVYFYMDKNSVFHLLDGDKIATLIAKYLKELVEKSDLKLQIKVIQTAYANGSSTDYIQNVLKVPVMCVPTGVKYLHHEAKQCDIGVYFEANGHGTVVFSEKTKAMVKELAMTCYSTDIQKKMAKKFLNTIDLINETVGDAISDLLLVEAILFDQDLDIAQWNAFYKDYPNKQLKVKVPDRRAITTTDAERICVEPAGLQEAINSTLTRYKNARAFVSHCGIYGNKQADFLAKEASTLHPPCLPIPLRNTKRLLRNNIRQRRISSLRDMANGKTWARLLDTQTRLQLSHLPRVEGVTSFRIITGHDYLQAHLFRIGLVDSPLCPLCNTTHMTGEHLFSCPSLLHIRSDDKFGALSRYGAASLLYWTARRLMSERTLAGVI